LKPVHPILVHFPIALLSLSVAADVIGFFGVASLRDTGWWALLGAALGGVATVAAGLFDMQRAKMTEAVHHRVHRHMHVGLVLVVAIVGLAVWRGSVYYAGGIVPMFYLDMAVLTMALATFQGWLGGELVYTDGVFVAQGKPVVKEGGDNGKSKDQGHNH
jgi:uncharacterized membrane protein